MKPPSHQDLILDQFTRQAAPFSTAKTITDETALRLLVDFSGAGPEDAMLDVACGGGLVVCAFARAVRHATGIDVTPAMLDRARALAQSKGLGNVSWNQGDVQSLPIRRLSPSSCRASASIIFWIRLPFSGKCSVSARRAAG